ncbi:MAG: nicotinate (nicotinamide) nucleotide adenylyltransferase [Betaproteobacteria bacterium]|nr:nicotinate (nicotinamide) nucleotide adenylyltransferase [Betaproteobacteria bacterium]
MAQAIGILGGTFDPVHNAHLAIANAALQSLGLQQLLWLPTGTPPYRPAPVATAAQRLAMLKLATADEPRYVVDERELQPSASGFTFDALLSLQDDYPGASLKLLLGADQYAKRATWHRWTDLEKLCEIAVFARPGCCVDATARTIAMTPLTTSASSIRARLARDEDVSAMLPPPVLDYILKKGLYH